MCGIAGISSRTKISTVFIEKMLNKLAHRGPDDEGYLLANDRKLDIFGGRDTPEEVFYYSNKLNYIPNKKLKYNLEYNLALGHRRLSILDISPKGHQPITYKDSNIWLIFNGEIYNYKELKKDLEKKGYKFYTDTDTEVVIVSYIEWGIDCLSRFNGMWSFVIYDRNKNILWGARDRFGVKPLYYYLDNIFFSFASEIKALLILPFIKNQIHEEVLLKYLALGTIENIENTFFKDIKELLPAHAFIFDIKKHNFKLWKFYNLKYNNEWEKINDKKLTEYIEQTKELVIKAIALHIRSDVPVGTCLSGGLDSSTIVSSINYLLKNRSYSQIGEKQKVFTAVYNSDKSVDESKWAEIVVKHTNTEWYKTFPTANELLEDIEDIVYYQDIPFLSTSIYAQYRVMKLASENGIKVLLDGQGADEVFAGYGQYFVSFYLELLKHFDFIRFKKELTFLNNAPVSINYILKNSFKYIFTAISPNIIINTITPLVKYNINYLNKNFVEEYRDSLTKSITNKAFFSLNKHLYNSINSFQLTNLLRYEDRNSMRFSIESRTPFADDINLIEFIFNIPSSYKIYKGWSKFLLREAMKDILPDRIRYRTDKIGFATPEIKWLSEVSEPLKQFFLNPELKYFLNINKLLKEWEILLNKEKINITNIWKFINFSIWYKKFLD